MDNQENGNMPSEEEKSEFEVTLLDAILEAENGNDEMKKVLFEMSVSQAAAAYTACSVKTIIRLIKFYCSSSVTLEKASAIEVLGKASSMGQVLLKDTARWAGDLEINTYDITHPAMFATQLAYLLNNFNNDKSSGKDFDGLWFEALGGIVTVANKGYTFAQYWMGRLAEVDKDYSDAHGCVTGEDPKERAIAWYQKAAEQGCAEAKKRLEIVAEQRQREIAAERKIFGKCTYCGGYFKGIFKKVCCSCGKPKDY